MEKSSTKSDLLLIPSAIVVPEELRLDIGSVPTGMTPLRGRPMLDRIAEQYEQLSVTRIVAVCESADTIKQFASQNEYEWHVVDVGETTSIADTITATLESFESSELRDRNLFINFADTLISPIRQIDNIEYISYDKVDRPYRWTTFHPENGQITQIQPKYKKIDGSNATFVGQFGLTDSEAFLSCLNNSEVWGNYSLPRFYASLLAYLDSREYETYKPEAWYDVGHLDTYHKTNKQFINAREFNEFQVDRKNVITKRSDDTRTLINEIQWYQQIPTNLQPYLPRIYNWSTDSSDPYIDMEYIGYSSLADIQLYGAHGPHIWDSILHRIFDLLTDLDRHSLEPEPTVMSEALEEMYVSKTRRRLEQLQDNPAFAEIFESDSLVVNENEVPSVNSVLAQLPFLVRENNLLGQESMSVIHGDLCLPNILYDPRNEILKLIDPRGAFGKFTIYGDHRYDLAKLRHSFVGHYEHLINDMYSASWSVTDNEISYEIQVSEEQDQRAVRFDSILQKRAHTQLREVKLIEALLFLSMVSLHSDSHERQLCMLAQGLEKVSPYLDEGDF